MKTKIKQNIKDAMISKDTVARDVLRVLIGEIERKEQSPKGKISLSDLEIVALIKKMSENIKDMDGDEYEIKILEKYLPKVLTRYEIEDIVDNYIIDFEIADMKGMGRIMGYFKSTYPNQYDGKLVSTIIKEVLQ